MGAAGPHALSVADCPRLNAKREAIPPQREGCESYRRLREMRETQATKELSKPRRVIQACLHLLLCRAGQSSECMSQGGLMSPGKKTPTQKESRSFGKDASVPFETLRCALDHCLGMCGSPWIGSRGNGAVMIR